MKFTINAGLLAETIAAAISSLPTKPAAPVLGGVLIEAQLGTVVFSSFNYDRSTSRVVAADVTDTDTAVVSGRLLALIGGNLPKRGEAVVTAHDTEMEIHTGRTKYRLPLMIAEDYPRLPTMSPDDVIGSISCDALTSAVRAIGSFASTEVLTESTKMLAALNIITGPESIVLRATDRYVAGHRHVPWSRSRDVDLEINVAAADVLSTIKAVGYGASDEVELLCNGNLFGVRTLTTQVTTRMLGEEFPNLNRMMNVAVHSSSATVPTATLASMLKRAASIADDEHTKVDVCVTDDTLAVTTSDETSTGGLADDVDAVQHGPGHRLTLSSKRLLNALVAVDSDTVTLGFQDKSYLVHIYPGEIEPGLDGDLRPPATATAAMLMGIRSV